MLQLGYKIVYLSKNTYLSLRVAASSKAQALATLGVNQDSVVSIQRTIVRTTGITQEKQNNVLLELCSALLSKQDTSLVLLNALKGQATLLAKAKHLIDSGTAISQILKHLNFHPIVVQIIASGELTGNMNNAIFAAIDFNELDIEIKHKTKGIVLKQSFKLFVPLPFIIVMSVFFYEHLEKNFKPNELNFMSEILMFIGSNALYVSSSLLFLSVVLVLVKNYIWRFINRFFPFSLFELLNQFRLSIAFILIFKSLYFFGIDIIQIVKNYAEINRVVGNRLLDKLKQGISPDKAMLAVGFQKDFAMSMSSIETMTDVKVKSRALDILVKVLIKKIDSTTKKISFFITVIAVAMVVFAILLLLIGFYIPTILVNL